MTSELSVDDQALWRALQPLRSVSCFLMTGAHPDDEWNGFLAWLHLGLGVETVFACSTRGEGGQNALGPERGVELAAIRSREMERASGEIGLRLAWLGAGPGHGLDDPIRDFGFSKSGADTLQRWGHERLVGRLVRLIRELRPDAMSPTFLDVPGQHGHHRAMTQATREAIGHAADPAYPCALGVWAVPRFYLPAYSGAGGSYDDELPPPAETVQVDLGARCAALGMSWAELGEVSRARHASQGMGRALPPGPRPHRLHLAMGVSDATRPLDGVSRSLGDLAETAPASVAPGLRAAGGAVAEALAAFPDRAAVADALHRALGALPLEAAGFERILDRKRRQLGCAAALALEVGATFALPHPLRAGRVNAIRLAVRGRAGVVLRGPAEWALGETAVEVPESAPGMGTLRDGWDPLGGSDVVGAELCWVHGGVEGRCVVDPDGPVAVAPARAVSVSPERVVRRVGSARAIRLRLEGAAAPVGWHAVSVGDGEVEVTAPVGASVLESAGRRLWMGAEGSALVVEASARVLRAEVAIDAACRVGVVAGPVDGTLAWLRALDIPAEAVSDAMLSGDLSQFTTLVVGIFGFGQRPELGRRGRALRDWMEAGGNLVTLYHRPGDGWDPAGTPPFLLEIGQPSLRFRVTDPEAEVVVLEPGHRLLRVPNVIAAADWAGWARERGLYFARHWDPAYVALLAMADADEAALRGGLLVAQVGRGQHVHVALALHHQWEALVPGAFRLLANLVSRPSYE